MLAATINACFFKAQTTSLKTKNTCFLYGSKKKNTSKQIKMGVFSTFLPSLLFLFQPCQYPSLYVIWIFLLLPMITFFFFFWRSRSYLFSHENVGGKACLGGCNCDSCIKFVWFILFFIKKNMGAKWFCCFIIVNTSSSMQTTLVSKQKFSGMCPLPPL